MSTSGFDYLANLLALRDLLARRVAERATPPEQSASRFRVGPDVVGRTEKHGGQRRLFDARQQAHFAHLRREAGLWARGQEPPFDEKQAAQLVHLRREAAEQLVHLREAGLS